MRISSALEENMRLHRSTIKEDVEFHKLLLQSTRNPLLVELVPLLVEYFRLAVLYQPSAILHNYSFGCLVVFALLRATLRAGDWDVRIAERSVDAFRRQVS
jgi:hypothetical protein